MKLARFVLSTVVGTFAGLVVGYIPATVVLNMFMFMPWATDATALVWFATAGAIVAIFQRSSRPGVLPRWWLLASGVGWATLIALAGGARGADNMDLRLAIPASFLFSLLVGGALLLRRRNAPLPVQTNVPSPRAAGRFGGFRTGALAAPMYLFFAGVGHVPLALIMSSLATGPRDGQAFSGLFVLGLMFVVLGLATLPIAFGYERGVLPFVRGASVGLVVALVVVAYTASRGIERGGVAGVPLPCIVEQGREICPPGDGTYIMDARPDIPVMLLAALGAYALAHLLGRLRPARRALSLDVA
jgi:hypothetical protein